MEKIFAKLKEEQYRVPFMSAMIIGLMTHMFMLVNKFPNVDSMTNFYFDQNMVTSGRWFLTVACGISSYYDLNFVNGLLAIIFIALGAVLVTRFFDVKRKSSLILIPAIMATFPAVAATMSYMYTVDGYMLGLLMAISAAYIARKYKFGFLIGAAILALSMGTYQAYVSVTILLCIFDIMLSILEDKELYDLWNKIFKYLIMGIAGGALYFGILKLCLLIEHKELDTYQGLNEMGKLAIGDIPERLKNVYYDFFAFSFRGHIFVDNFYSKIIMCILVSATIVAIAVIFFKTKAYKKWYSWIIMIVSGALIPFGSNILLMMSSKVEYHLLMRMQWELFIVLAVVVAERTIAEFETVKDRLVVVKTVSVVLIAVLCYNFLLMDNIAYFNLQQKYEKTYAYCVRLLDRIEQTEGYYTGIPIGLVGVISKDSYPTTNLTGDITDKIRGTDGDFLIYKGEQYREFMKNYLGASLNILEGQDVEDMYYSEEYESMTTFPDKGSIKVVNGIMFVKLE
ncbi:MAG: glucosyltransferase domain-containing protein [Lachnospiraceae bacterium]|nr:glucosyltransferase domain-containing protein [Lachnospiraceae bacterium]